MPGKRMECPPMVGMLMGNVLDFARPVRCGAPRRTDMMQVWRALAGWWRTRDARRAGEHAADGDPCPYQDRAQQAAWYRGRRDRDTNALLGEW